MKKLVIDGGNALSGSVVLQGSKNGSLPVLAAAAAVNGISIIHNCPDLTDVTAAIKILEHIGCKVKREKTTVIVDARGACRFDISEKLMREMRSSIVFLGALIARFGKASMTPPGGCEIGLRPIDLHLSSLRGMGVEIAENGGILECRAPNGLRGRNINLAFPSVGATENIMLASLGAKGETVITNAAREPEIKDLADFLVKCGAKISGAGQSVIRIEGGFNANNIEHTVIPDRIVASTYMAAAACAGGKIAVKKINKEHIMPVVHAFEVAGCELEFGADELVIEAPERLRRVRYIRTMPYPGFPTDSQAVVMAMLTKARGTSIINENIFENRFRHVPELIKMGADIRVENNSVAVIEGASRLHAAKVTACDLRGGCALAVAALGADGTTVIDGIHHIDRGCQSIEKDLAQLGAKIKRI